MNRFPDGARVCFVGDSITRAGIFIKHIVAYYRENFPDSSVEFYNCGIAGGNLGNTLAVFEEDVAIYNPTQIVLMIAGNDARRGLLKEPPSPEKYDKLHEAYETYKERMRRFYELTRERGIELTLCTPMPYAEFADGDAPVFRGGYALNLGYAAFVREFARRHGIGLCEYFNAAVRAMQTESLFAADRTHPNERGHLCMAKAFLSYQGFEYNEPESFPADIEWWYELTQKFRNIITTEFLTVPRYYELTQNERAAYIEELSRKIERGEYCPDDFIKRQIEKYKINQPRGAEYRERLISFMKKRY